MEAKTNFCGISQLTFAVKTHANQQGENVRVQFYSSVCKMDKGRQKDGVKKKLLYYTTFFCAMSPFVTTMV